MKLKNLVPVLAIALLATACDYQKNNRIKQKDVREGNEHVYGVHPDSAAAQSKLKYAAKPELEVKANEIREKLFNK
ncbi:MAG: hypothetical protein RLZ91_1197 [Bacteroidota bacterium]|uniref:Lipoprotein n=1 Tax=Sandaracinomonas limnophila TaxID=1862386 RepID=A0A437PM21_9BACT|nr:hypothetical protein [Sandaracinomonas limnophila]RVU23337.1 hypothetical protein EOJ36_11435 [Sandaracinomonas limnophila]